MDALTFLVACLVVLLIFLVLLSISGWQRMRDPAAHCLDQSGRSKDSCIKTMAVLGTGGHTTEMTLLLKHLDRRHYKPLLFVYTNEFCRQTVEKMESSQDNVHNCMFLWISRSRKVGQSWLSSIFTTALAIPRAVLHILVQRPDLLVVNGPGVCIPVCLGAILLNTLLRHRCAIVFVESICRVKKLSLTGKLLRSVATSFFVQWPIAGVPAHAVCLAEESRDLQKPEASASGSMALNAQHCLVTVGTTNFDKMIRTLDANASDFLESLHRLGVNSATVQIGATSEFWPEALSKLANVRVVRTLPHAEFLQEVQNASLMIGHAGAGTILEALSARKRLIVVPNRSLMDDHQLELCQAVAGKYCLSCTEDNIVTTMQQAQEAFQHVSCALPPHLTTTAFAERLDKMLRASTK